MFRLIWQISKIPGVTVSTLYKPRAKIINVQGSSETIQWVQDILYSSKKCICLQEGQGISESANINTYYFYIIKK